MALPVTLLGTVDCPVWYCTGDGPSWDCTADNPAWDCTADRPAWDCTGDNTVWNSKGEDPVWDCTCDGPVHLVRMFRTVAGVVFNVINTTDLLENPWECRDSLKTLRSSQGGI